MLNQITKTRVLIVDDEPNIATAIDFLMQQQGYETTVARDGEEALQAIADFQPNLVILDVMMPRKDGLETATAIRQSSAYQDVPIIFLTARDSEQDKLKGYEAGGELYLTKPFDNHDLVAMVNELRVYG
ncbi:MAG: response regulator [Bacteroidota bacterium]